VSGALATADFRFKPPSGFHPEVWE